VLEVNILGYVYGARAALPYFREQGRGVLINVSSMVGAVGQPYSVPYSISKFAIRGLSLSLEQELADEQNIRVCSVLPGVIDTPIFNQAANYSGRAIKPPRPVLPAQKVANAIVELAIRPKKEVYVGAMARAAKIGRALSPSRFDRMINRMIQRDHFEALPASPSEGNLFAPLPDWATVSGGWENWSRTAPAVSKLGIALAGATMGVLAWWFFRVSGQATNPNYSP
jgi:NAD(P)-dependent dehydrogenase (short-subunit alcohol dehydrogenase family)